MLPIFHRHYFGGGIWLGYVRFGGAYLENNFPKELVFLCFFGCAVMESMCWCLELGESLSPSEV